MLHASLISRSSLLPFLFPHSLSKPIKVETPFKCSLMTVLKPFNSRQNNWTAAQAEQRRRQHSFTETQAMLSVALQLYSGRGAVTAAEQAWLCNCIKAQAELTDRAGSDSKTPRQVWPACVQGFFRALRPRSSSATVTRWWLSSRTRAQRRRRRRW